MATAAATLPLPAVRRVHHWQERLAQGLLIACCAALALFLFAPLAMILVKSVQDKDGAFVGLLQFQQYFQTPALRQSIVNTMWVATVVTVVTVPLAFTYAYALTRSSMPWRGFSRVIALTPILAPPLMRARSFVQCFGMQGLLTGVLGGPSVYGPIGIILSSTYAPFPHALMIVIHTLLLSD